MCLTRSRLPDTLPEVEPNASHPPSGVGPAATLWGNQAMVERIRGAIEGMAAGAAIHAIGEAAHRELSRAPTQALPPAAHAPAPARERAEGAAGTRSPAAESVTAAARPLPHLGAIQSAFGQHDVTGARAQVGGAAGEASKAMDAHGFAVDGAVGFEAEPDLRTAAHEAAHLVQRRGPAGAEGDEAQERHADAVAERVATGRSAEDLLDRVAPGVPEPGPAIASPSSGPAQLKRKKGKGKDEGKDEGEGKGEGKGENQRGAAGEQKVEGKGKDEDDGKGQGKDKDKDDGHSEDRDTPETSVEGSQRLTEVGPTAPEPAAAGNTTIDMATYNIAEGYKFPSEASYQERAGQMRENIADYFAQGQGGPRAMALEEATSQDYSSFANTPGAAISLADLRSQKPENLLDGMLAPIRQAVMEDLLNNDATANALARASGVEIDQIRVYSETISTAPGSADPSATFSRYSAQDKDGKTWNATFMASRAFNEEDPSSPVRKFKDGETQRLPEDTFYGNALITNPGLEIAGDPAGWTYSKRGERSETRGGFYQPVRVAGTAQVGHLGATHLQNGAEHDRVSARGAQIRELMAQSKKAMDRPVEGRHASFALMGGDFNQEFYQANLNDDMIAAMPTHRDDAPYTHPGEERDFDNVIGLGASPQSAEVREGLDPEYRSMAADFLQTFHLPEEWLSGMVEDGPEARASDHNMLGSTWTIGRRDANR